MDCGETLNEYKSLVGKVLQNDHLEDHKAKGVYREVGSEENRF
jgi:hypothetical protein